MVIDCKGKACKKHTYVPYFIAIRAEFHRAFWTRKALTRSPNTRRARIHWRLRESVVTTASSPVMVVRPSPSSTRRCVSVQDLRPLTLSHLDEIGKDHEEGRAPARVHCLQIQDAALTQALQAVRAISFIYIIDIYHLFQLRARW